MIRHLVTIFISTSVLIACAGATAPKILAVETISEGTSLTLGLVLAAITFFAVSAWKLGQWVMKETEHSREQDKRIEDLENILSDCRQDK